MNASWLVVMGVVGMPQEPELDTVAEVVAYLRDRNAQIQEMTCRYELRTEPSDYLVNQRARLDGRSREDVVRQYEARLDCVFKETRDGWFRLELTRLDSEGVPENQRVLCYDGEDTYLGTLLFSSGEISTPRVRVKDRIRANYEVESQARRILSDTVLPPSGESHRQTWPLFRQIESADTSEMLPEEAIGEANCLVIRWRTLDEGILMRETVWLDIEHGLAMRKYQEEGPVSPGSEDWAVTDLWEVQELDSCRLARDPEDSSTYWYPSHIEQTIHDMESNIMFVNTVHIRDVELNSSLPQDSFTFEIEDGTSVMDASTGMSRIHGGGLSPRLQKMVEQRVEEGRRELAARADVQAQDRVMQPERHWSDLFPWLAFGFGGVGLAAAAWMRRRG